MKRSPWARVAPEAVLADRHQEVLAALKLTPERALADFRPRAYRVLSRGLAPKVRDGSAVSLLGRLVGEFRVTGSYRDGRLIRLAAPFEVANARLRYSVELTRMVSGGATEALGRVIGRLHAQYSDRWMLASGRVQWGGQGWQLSFTDAHVFGEGFEALWEGMPASKALAVPVYPLVKGVSQDEARETMRVLVRQVRAGGVDAEALSDFSLPAEVTRALAEAGRPALDLGAALIGLHGGYVMPTDRAQLLASASSPFHKALDLPEAWRSLSGQDRYSAKTVSAGVPLQGVPDVVSVLDSWPFPPTGGQRAAVSEIAQQLASGDTSPRLLQGDVGSGKTAVMAAAAAMMMQSGYQVAVLAPTDVLAEQLYQALSQYMARCEGAFDSSSVVRYSPRLKVREKRAFQRLAAGDQPLLAVGTHGLSDQEFGKLGLVIVDEEQQFSAAVKAALNLRYPAAYQLLVSATPIPRTLASTLYAGVPVTVLSERPASRLPIKTEVVEPEAAEERAVREIQRIIGLGQQVYVVCPAIESDVMASVGETQGWLQQALGREVVVDVIHGGLSDVKADEALSRFKAGQSNVLVGTTILAVGVDVPNASLMVVLDPQMMGVSQLHQIRGRVGRGSEQGYCLLMPTRPLSERQQEGLAYIASNSDGFALAEYDLKMRGEGHFGGRDQSGKGLDWAFLEQEARIMVSILEQQRARQMDLVSAEPGDMYGVACIR